MNFKFGSEALETPDRTAFDQARERVIEPLTLVEQELYNRFVGHVSSVLRVHESYLGAVETSLDVLPVPIKVSRTVEKGHESAILIYMRINDDIYSIVVMLDEFARELDPLIDSRRDHMLSMREYRREVFSHTNAINPLPVLVGSDIYVYDNWRVLTKFIPPISDSQWIGHNMAERRTTDPELVENWDPIIFYHACRVARREISQTYQGLRSLANAYDIFKVYEHNTDLRTFTILPARSIESDDIILITTSRNRSGVVIPQIFTPRDAQHLAEMKGSERIIVARDLTAYEQFVDRFRITTSLKTNILLPWSQSPIGSKRPRSV